MTKMLTIIPARGGSKGIPQKNLQTLAGKPLIVYSIEQALAVPSMDRVVVSTDDLKIKEVAQQAGAEIINRPTALGSDTATSESALIHTLDSLRETEKYEPDIVVFLQVTSPLREDDDIRKAIEHFKKENADSLFSAYPFHGFLWRREAQDLKSLNYDFKNRPRRQDAPDDFIENGSIYIFKPRVLQKMNNRLGGKIVTYEMPFWKALQVDQWEDLELCEYYMKKHIHRIHNAA